MKNIFIIILISLFSLPLISQDDNNGLEQEDWEAIRDKFAVDAIKLLAKIDTLKGNIDSLKTVLDYVNNFDCEEELYKSIGTTKEEVADFRSKFQYTENRINNKEGTPQDARKMYFDEITASKLRCLPEFKDRYWAMSKAINEMYATVIPETKKDTTVYLVTEGDNLRTIAEKVYGSQLEWKKIWYANKNGVANSDELPENFMKKIFHPDRIYPGQKLHIPPR